MRYPNESSWRALDEGLLVMQGDKTSFLLSTIDCGVLNLPSGQLVVSDPFAGLTKHDNQYIQLPAGSYHVVVTLADVSEQKDGSHMREAYASLLLDEAATEVGRKIITPVKGDDKVPSELDDEGNYHGFFVDAGTASFVDAQAVARLMPDEDAWNDELFDSTEDDCWFKRMDKPDHIRDGLANIRLPNATQGENIILVHSGWGDGVYPVIGGYDKAGNLVRVHIDFMIIPAESSLE